MKKKYTLIVAMLMGILFSATTKANANITFADANFKSKLLESSTSNTIAKDLTGNYFKIDANDDGEIDESEAQSVSSLSVFKQQITNLSGIEYFTNLKYLYCYENHITSLDLSQNTQLIELNCNNNPLTSIDLSNNTALILLHCDNNRFTSLDLSKNTLLQELEAANNQIESLDVSKNILLTTLYVNNNMLTSLDISKNTSLNKLRCDSNSLTTLNLKNGIKGISTSFSGNDNITNICSDENEKADVEALLIDYGYSVDVVTDCVETPPPTGSATQVLCPSDYPTVENLVATGTEIKWYSKAFGGTPLESTEALTPGSSYYASQTLNGFESISRFMTTVIDEVAPPTGNTQQTFCSAQNATIADLVAIGTAINWYDSPTGDIALDSTHPLSSITYYATQTISCESVNRLSVNVIINDAVIADVAVMEVTLCGTPTIADLNMGTIYDSVDAETAIPATTKLVNGITYYGGENTTDLENCSQTTRYPINVTLNNTEPPTPGDSEQTFCSLKNATIADLEVSGTDIKWYLQATGGTVLESSTALVTGTTYHASQTVDDCESLDRLAINVTINDVQDTAETPPTTMEFCKINQPTVADLYATSDVYNVATGGSPLDAGTALTTGIYYVGENTIDAETCTQTLREIIEVTIKSPPAPTGDSEQRFCGTTSLSLLNVLGSDLKWYTEDSVDSPIDSSAEVTATTYFVSQTVNGCESERLAITVTEECLNVSNHDLDEFVSLHPNPVQNELIIETPDLLQKVTIYNTQGQSVLTSTQSVINTSELNTGTYIVIIETNQGTVSKKLIKQ
ncbi:MAG: T9SS type A sorting domain-containing protein [Flavobacteriales bacterium]|nr:T9SS type A sorting domain-containing protein [Flavobacteriales bacterium]